MSSTEGFGTANASCFEERAGEEADEEAEEEEEEEEEEEDEEEEEEEGAEGAAEAGGSEAFFISSDFCLSVLVWTLRLSRQPEHRSPSEIRPQWSHTH
jgi:hypothetical protein